MSLPAVSVIIVSRGRAPALRRCLIALAQLDYPMFEVVIVADTAGIAAARGTPLGHIARLVEFDLPNISAARNHGIAHAAGEIVAFIDDDAVPEPGWLRHLCAPFARADVATAAGYVIGRNGISLQWGAQLVDKTARHHPITYESDAPLIPTPPPGQTIGIVGTNCAFRTEILRGIGGFDPAFSFYLDETDLNMRLARAGHATAIVPLAQVHHGYAESARRRADRMPRDLFDIGASSAVFWRKHAPEAAIPAAEAALIRTQHRRLITQMVRGNCEPRDIAPLMASLRRGLDAGKGQRLAPLPPIAATQDAFAPAAMPQAPMQVLAGRIWQAARLRRRAADIVAAGGRVTLYLFDPSARFHRIRFRPQGYWEQSGGLFGRSQRSDPLFRLTRFSARLARETARVAPMRQISG